MGLSDSVAPLLDAPWIEAGLGPLDTETTVALVQPLKPLYGNQEGAVVSYNPSKRGRPSHSIGAR